MSEEKSDADRARSIFDTLSELREICVPKEYLAAIYDYARNLNPCKHCGKVIEPCGDGWIHTDTRSSLCQINKYAEPKD